MSLLGFIRVCRYSRTLYPKRSWRQDRGDDDDDDDDDEQEDERYQGELECSEDCFNENLTDTYTLSYQNLLFL